MEKKYSRYNPKIHGSTAEYLSGSQEGNELDTKVHFALNSVFTELSDSFANKVAECNKYGLYIPENLVGQPLAITVLSRKEKKYFQTIDRDFIDSCRYKVYSGQGRAQDLINIYVPIMENAYGVRIAIALAAAARAGYTLTSELMREDCRETDQNHEYLIENETLQKNSFLTLCEGQQTIAAGIGHLLGYRLKNHPNPLQLTKKIIDKNLTVPFAANGRFGSVIPPITHGEKYAFPLCETEEDVTVSPQFIQLLRDEKQEVFKGKSRPGKRLKGCPVVRQNTPITQGIVSSSGIELVARTMYPYIEHYYYNQPTDIQMPDELLDQYWQEVARS